MSLIIYSREGPLARITLNRPEKLNAFNVELVDELMAAVLKAAASEARMGAMGKGLQDTGSTAKAFAGEEVDW